MNNTSSILELVNKIPISIYFAELPDRQQALKYLEYLYANVPASKQVDANRLFREIISRELRGVSMKIIEPEILLLVALNNITLADFTLPSNDLVRKVIAENQDKYDLDIMQRVMAQIMTKLPHDLREQVAGKHKLKIFQLIARQLNMDHKLLEKFTNYDASLNYAVSMELDAGDYNTLNKKYLQELYNYQKKQPYISANSLEYGSLAAEMALSQPTGAQTTTPDLSVSKAQYIDQSPSLMVGTQDKKLYYFDPSSGTLSEMPLNNNQIPVSGDDLKTILASQKINQADIQGAIDKINSTAPATTIPTVSTTTIPAGFFASLEKAFSGLSTGTTQAQAALQTAANLAPTEPVPPAFLTKLYKLKHGTETGGNYSRDGNYQQMMTGLGGSISSSRGYQQPSNLFSSEVASLPTGMYSNQFLPNFMPNARDGGYTENAELPIFNVTNPQTTYAAFSGPAPNQTNPSNTTPSTTTPSTTTPSTTKSNNTTPSTTTPSTTTPRTVYTFANGELMSQDAINMEKAYKLLYNTYQHNPTTTKKSNFSNLASNSKTVATTEQTVAAKIKNDTKNVEKIAIGFITILILIFLIAVITYVKNAKSS
jgi:hypothetical protein